MSVYWKHIAYLLIIVILFGGASFIWPDLPWLGVAAGFAYGIGRRSMLAELIERSARRRLIEAVDWREYDPRLAGPGDELEDK